MAKKKKQEAGAARARLNRTKNDISEPQDALSTLKSPERDTSKRALRF